MKKQKQLVCYPLFTQSQNGYGSPDDDMINKTRTSMSTFSLLDAMILAALLALAIALPADALRLGKPAPSSGLSSSSTQRFPEDLFAQPAFKVSFEQQTVTNETAQLLLTGGGQNNLQHHQHGKDPLHHDGSQAAQPQHHYLMHTSPSTAHLCSLTQPAARKPASQTLSLTPSNLLPERHRVIRSGLELLSELNGKCLYYTSDWFTISLCFGEAIRQFRAIESTIGPGKIPAQDPSQHAYVLGRWKPPLEIVGGQFYRHKSSSPPDPKRITTSSESTPHKRVSTSSDSHSPTSEEPVDDENGTELMEVIKFVNSDDTEHRYLSQIWSDGTLCDINNEPRSVEVQYHCNSNLQYSQITTSKETTTCHYVLIVETPILCKEPQLRGAGHTSSSSNDKNQQNGGKAASSKVGQWKCRKIVDGPTSQVGDVGSGQDSQQEDEVVEQVGEDDDKSVEGSGTAEPQSQGDDEGVADKAEPAEQESGNTDRDEQSQERKSVQDESPGQPEQSSSSPGSEEASFFTVSLDENGQVQFGDVDGDIAASSSSMNEELSNALESLFQEAQLLMNGEKEDDDYKEYELELGAEELQALFDNHAQDGSKLTEKLKSILKEQDDRKTSEGEKRNERINKALLQSQSSPPPQPEQQQQEEGVNERDGSSDIFNELNAQARQQPQQQLSSHDTLRKKIMDQIQKQNAKQQGQAPKPGPGPNFHGPNVLKEAAVHVQQPQQKVESFADRAQRFYDERHQKKSKAQENGQKGHVRDEL
ncbi:unnamed protein product [Sympodiomycopsis kandeliae]